MPEPPEPVIDYLVPLNAKECRTGEVHLLNQCFVAEREISQRGKIIQIEILVPRLFEFKTGSPEFFCLRLQLDLVYLEFMHDGVLGWGRESPEVQCLLCPFA